jgi:hypothetical protein
MSASDYPPGHALVVRPHLVTGHPLGTSVGRSIECTHANHRSRAPGSANSIADVRNAVGIA